MSSAVNSSIAEPGHVPRVSVGLPVFNGESDLPGAIDALLAQTFSDFEIVISDNGSTDRTPEICRAYAARDPRIRYERQPKNMGLYWNCNRVAEMARGEFFKWSCADVLHAPEFLERCVSVLDADATVVCCHTRSDYIDPQGRRLYGVDPAGDGRLGTSPVVHRRFADVLFTHGWGARSFAVMRLDALRKTGLLEYHYGWDKVMMAGLALQGRYHIVDETLCFEQDHPTIQAGRDGRAGGHAASALPSTHDREGNGFHRFAFVRGYLRMAWGLSPDVYTSIRCTGWVLLYPFQIRKWGRLTCAAVGRSRLWAGLRRLVPLGAGRGARRQARKVV
ncbi:MAG: glycosyltransferase family 2 protein [Planctomycetota bacterium]